MQCELNVAFAYYRDTKCSEAEHDYILINLTTTTARLFFFFNENRGAASPPAAIY